MIIEHEEMILIRLHQMLLLVELYRDLLKIRLLLHRLQEMQHPIPRLVENLLDLRIRFSMEMNLILVLINI